MEQVLVETEKPWMVGCCVLVCPKQNFAIVVVIVVVEKDFVLVVWLWVLLAVILVEMVLDRMKVLFHMELVKLLLKWAR
jgi:hypothetical protein